MAIPLAYSLYFAQVMPTIEEPAACGGFLRRAGSVYAFVPQQKQQKLFNIIGMNVVKTGLIYGANDSRKSAGKAVAY